MLLLKNPSELQSPFCMFIYSHPFTCGVFMSISIAYPLCKYLSCVWGWKNLVRRGLLNRWTAWKIFLQPPHPSTMQLCANAGEDSSIQAVFFFFFLTYQPPTERQSYILVLVWIVMVDWQLGFPSAVVAGYVMATVPLLMECAGATVWRVETID